jgi:hypothetical protein
MDETSVDAVEFKAQLGQTPQRRLNVARVCASPNSNHVVGLRGLFL